jgi:galactose oxidase-like protein/IPT/TIG domain-containing protein/glyoxal oxidase-like protein
MFRGVSSARLAQILLALFLAPAALIPQAMAQADVQGQWSTLNYSMTINPIHVALMHNGNILVTTGSGNCPPSQSGCPSGPPYNGSNHSGAVVVDPVAKNITQLSVGWDMFCNGMTVLPDGRVMVTGGTIAFDPFLGIQNTNLFDPATNTFTAVQSMAHGRWYPSVTLLSDGRVMTFSGYSETGPTNSTVEFYTVGSGWSSPISAGWTPPLYPRLHLLPNGNVFYSGSTSTSLMFNPSNNSWTTVANTNLGSTRLYGSSVLLPLTPANSYDPKVLILGGGNPATATTELIDLGAPSPAWTWGPDMTQPRIEMDAVILPTGKILALGGSASDEDGTTASLNADLYDPASNSFSSAGANAYPRLYHSVALLLPDATVWIAGSNPARGTWEKRMEGYQPAYLFTRDGNNNIVAATRPTIASAPANIAWGGQFSVSTPDAANISQAVLIRPGSSTHSFDFDQRLVGMSFTAGTGSLTVTAPPNSKIAPAGYYMLFLINNKGVPSVASFVLLGISGSNPAPTVTSISPNTGTTAGGNGVTITGTGFLSGATVTLGGTAATGVSVVNSTSINATTAAHAAGAANVVVTNTDNQIGSLTSGYTYSNPGNPAPNVTSITPNSGPASGGTAVTITGTGFLTGATVSLGTAATGVNVVNSTSITAMTAAHAAGVVSVVVTNSDAQSSTLSNAYTYVPAPAVTAVNPGTGPTNGGTGLSITGTNFQSGATVSFGGTAATGVTVAGNTSITATAPAHAAGTVDVAVTNPDGQSATLAGGYAYSAAEANLGLGVPYGDSSSATIAAGQTASYTLSIGGQGMSGTASLTCTGAPAGATCSLPTSQTFSATVPTTFTIKVATTARIAAALSPVFTPASWLWTMALGMLLVPSTRARKWSARRWRRYLWLAPLMLLFFSVSCGGGGSMSNPQPQQTGTPSGTYTVVVNASASSKTGTTSLTLNVQ